MSRWLSAAASLLRRRREPPTIVSSRWSAPDPTLLSRMRRAGLDPMQYEPWAHAKYRLVRGVCPRCGGDVFCGGGEGPAAIDICLACHAELVNDGDRWRVIAH
ncbi:MAG: hypothetical protein ACE5O2_16845 [Armatimonadota bacterium]